MGIIDNIIQDKQDIKNQLGSTPNIFPTVKKFNNKFEVKRHSTKLNSSTVAFGSFVLNSSSFGVLGTDELGRGGHTDSVYAIIPHNNIFVERFFQTEYIDTGNSTGTLGVDSYSLDVGEVLQSEVIAKLRVPITKAKLLSNDDFIDTGTGMFLPFTLGVDTFGSDNISIEFSNDSGVTWFEANEDEEYTFATSTSGDELKYRLTNNGATTLNINKPLFIEVN